MMSHVTFTLRISVKLTTPFALMMDLRLAVELHVLVLSFHGIPETILLQASMRDFEGIITSFMVLQERKNDKSVVYII
jgi:hypothetical protein